MTWQTHMTEYDKEWAYAVGIEALVQNRLNFVFCDTAVTCMPCNAEEGSNKFDNNPITACQTFAVLPVVVLIVIGVHIRLSRTQLQVRTKLMAARWNVSIVNYHNISERPQDTMSLRT